jgi:hypothetical protein
MAVSVAAINTLYLAVWQGIRTGRLPATYQSRRFKMGVFTKQTDQDKQAAREAAEIRRLARQLARGGAVGDVHIRAVAGLRVYAARLSAAGDGVTAAEIVKRADEAQGLLDAAAETRAQIATPRPDFVGEACRAAAAEFCKRLPACYPSIDDGLAAASRLPLIEARRAESLACDAAAKRCRQASEKHHEAVRVIEAAALVAMGGHDDAKAIQALVAMAG